MFELSDRVDLAKDSRHRYVSELFRAALFYWVNKFYDGELDLAHLGESAELRLAWGQAPHLGVRSPPRTRTGYLAVGQPPRDLPVPR